VENNINLLNRICSGKAQLDFHISAFLPEIIPLLRNIKINSKP
jgi:hypothetical protein